MTATFAAVSGIFNIFSGVALIFYWYAFALFLPYGKISTTLSILVRNKHWVWINTLGLTGALAGLLGQAGIWVALGDTASWQSMVGFFLACCGTTLLIATMSWETVLWPILRRVDESLLDFSGPIYTSRVFFPFFIVAGILYALGYVFVGIGVVKSGVLPAATGYLISIGAPMFGLGSMFGKAQVYPRSLGVTAMSVALVWIGISM